MRSRQVATLAVASALALLVATTTQARPSAQGAPSGAAASLAGAQDDSDGLLGPALPATPTLLGAPALLSGAVTAPLRARPTSVERRAARSRAPPAS